jgi:hypothetical protein
MPSKSTHGQVAQAADQLMLMSTVEEQPQVKNLIIWTNGDYAGCCRTLIYTTVNIKNGMKGAKLMRC